MLACVLSTGERADAAAGSKPAIECVGHDGTHHECRTKYDSGGLEFLEPIEYEQTR